jgi:hypothetical protein
MGAAASTSKDDAGEQRLRLRGFDAYEREDFHREQGPVRCHPPWPRHRCAAHAAGALHRRGAWCVSAACLASSTGLSALTWFAVASDVVAELQVCGRPIINPEAAHDLRGGCSVCLLLLLADQMHVCDALAQGSSANDPHIRHFWTVLKDRFDDIERAKLLRFTWGRRRSRLPVRAEDFTTKFTIARLGASERDPDKFLAVAHTVRPRFLHVLSFAVCSSNNSLSSSPCAVLLLAGPAKVLDAGADAHPLAVAITHSETIDTDFEGGGVTDAAALSDDSDDEDVV